MHYKWIFCEIFNLLFSYIFYKKIFFGWNLSLRAPTSAPKLKAMPSLHKGASFPLSPVKFEGKFCARYRFELLARYRSRENPLGSVFAQNFVNFQNEHAICQVALLWALLNKHWQYWNHVSDGGNQTVLLNQTWFLILHIWSGQRSI